MKTIWAVDSGEYSDYGVDGVFSTEENAKKFQSMFGGTVVEWEVDRLIPMIKPGHRPFEVKMEKNGDVKYVQTPTATFFNDLPTFMPDYPKLDKFIMTLYCFAKSRQHAIQIANDTRAKILKLNLWGKDLLGKL